MAAKDKKPSASNQKPKVINLREKVTVVSTSKDPHHKDGEEFKVHPEVAKRLVEKGFAKLASGQKIQDDAKDDEGTGDDV